jgi:hypothetical protein
MRPPMLEAATPQLIDEAIRLQMSFEFDREQLVNQIFPASSQFVEYIEHFAHAMLKGRISDQVSLVGTAFTIGIEIGVALVMVQEARYPRA